LLPQTRHAGGIAPAPARPSLSLPDPDSGAPWVFITLGTTFNRDPAFFRMAAQAALNMGCRPILAVGRLEQSDLAALVATLPAPAVVTERVDFASTLPWCSAAIHAGGAGTTHALVLHGVPQVIVPHAGDQGFQARAIARCAAGLHIPAREVTVDRFSHALALLLPDRSTYRASANWLRDEFAALGGIPRSADLLETAARASKR
jgi:UDP:flavonoid glycosyltransferase YjiC (YdhE family)